MYWRLGGGTLRGVSKPGWIVWSRVDVSRTTTLTGLAEVVKLPQTKLKRGGNDDPQWPIMHAILQGIDRDQMMGRHKANHPSGLRDGARARRADSPKLGDE
jgi:hypothetical protein